MKIDNIKVNKILDSRGNFTIEVEIYSENLKQKASIPSGKSKGSYEAISLNFDEIQNFLPKFLEEIKKYNFQNLQEFDHFLIERAGKNKENLGGNFTLGLSIPFARILAEKENLELYQYLQKEYNLEPKISLPKLVVNILGGGVHSFNNLDFQEYWIVSKDSFSGDLILKVLEAIHKLEKKLLLPLGRNDEGAICTNFKDNIEPVKVLKEIINENFELGIDVACNEVNLTNDELFKIYEELQDLEVKYLEDPFKEDDFDNFVRLKNNFSFKLIGDDLTTTNKERLKIAIDKNSIDGVIVKPNQIGTITETFEFTKLAKENNLFTIFSHRSGETNDNWLIDIGLAFGADYFKIGVPLQGERVAKWNRLLAIEKFF
jgi:enolase